MACSTVAVDFDGTLADKDMNPIPGALVALEQYLAAGLKVVVLSTRAHSVSGRIWIEEWLCKHGPFGSVRATNEKPDAVAYIDNLGWNPVTQGRFPTVGELEVLK